jgi:general secretion pathway protein D
MNKPRYAKIAFCGIILTAVFWYGLAQAQPVNSESEQNSTLEVGRDDPFANFLSNEKSTAQKVSQTSQPVEEKPELFLETITLKSLSAESFKAVIEGMSSPYGHVSIDKNSNTLIIYDTKEALAKIRELVPPKEIVTENLVQRSYRIVYANINEVEKTLRTFISKSGSLSSNPSTSNILVVDFESNIKVIDNFVKEIDRPMQQVLVEVKPELLVETVTLKFLDAKNLKTAIASMSSKYGSIFIDDKSNSLIVCDTKENLEKILAQIRKADKTPQQIMIEVVILDVKLNDETEIGVNWDFLTTKYNKNLGNDSKIGTSFRQSLGFSDTVTAIAETATTIADATAWNTIGTGSDFSLISGDIRNVVHLLQEKNNVEILASPRVMVLSGKESTIKAVEEIPYREQSDTSQGGATAMTSTQFKNVGVTLKVGATLTDGNSILLNVEGTQNVQTGTSVVSGVTGTPIIDTREIQSSLLMKDGQILVIGGLRRKETQKQTNQLPILGDLPIIGFAFRATDTIQNNSELLVILSPHIYTGEKLGDVEMEKFNEITKRPLLIIPEAVEKKKEEEKEKARIAKEAEKIEKAKKAKEAKKAEEANKKAKTAKKQKSE